MNKFDVIVVGDGTNGLICATYVARAGHSVALVPRSKQGRLTYSSDWRGSSPQSFPTYGSRLFDMGSQAARDFHLASFGLRTAKQGGGISFIEGREPFVRDANPAQMAGRLREHSPEDATAYIAFLQDLERFRSSIMRNLKSDSMDSVASTAKAQNFFESSLKDILNSYFKSQSLKDHLAQAVCNASLCAMGLGPHAPTTAFALLRDPVTRQDSVDRTRVIDQQELSDALTDVAVSSGVFIVADSQLADLNVERGRARGVKLTSGIELRARCVVADFDFGLQSATEGDAKSRARGAIAQINVTFDASPALHQKYLGMARQGSLFFNGGIENLESACDDWRLSEVPTRPPFEVVFRVPEEADGRDLGASIFVSYIPAPLSVGLWDEARRFTLCTEVTNEINRWMPDFSNHLTHIETVTPDMMASAFGVTNGLMCGAEQTFDQWLAGPSKIKNLLHTGPGARLFDVESGWSAREAARQLLGNDHLPGAA